MYSIEIDVGVYEYKHMGKENLVAMYMSCF